MAKPRIVVIGSANTDFVVQTPHLPVKGETVLGGRFLKAQGGKGANQAVAAARLGAEVLFVARLGRDSLGDETLASYRSEGIDISAITRDPNEPSGVALIMVSDSGENIIAVAPGANSRLSPDDVHRAEASIRTADCLLLQLEIPLETVQAAASLAHKHGVKTILNPAPARPLPTDLLGQIDILTPNEHEAAILLNRPAHSGSAGIAAQLSNAYGLKNLVVTLGSQGAFVVTNGQQVHLPAYPITPIDTTAAGDAFNGALAVALSRGETLLQAAQFASAAGALAATRPGAQLSLPTAGEMAAFLAENPTPLRD